MLRQGFAWLEASDDKSDFMPRKRFNIEGEIYFITTRTFKDKILFNNKIYCELLLNNLDFYRKKLKFKLLAYCVLLDHSHLLILPNKDENISKIMQVIKYRTASDIRKLNKTNLSCSREPGSRLRKRNVIWQKSFYDKVIRSDEELYNVIEYINNNAVKHNLVDDSLKWLYSSFHNYEQTEKEIISVDDLG